MRNRMLLTAMIPLALAGAARGHEGDHGEFAAAFAKPIEKAHGLANWKNKQAIRYDIRIEYGGDVMFAGTTSFDVHSEKVRMTTADGERVMVWDGEDAWYTPADAEIKGPRPRFHLRTWTYFLATPFKLRDPGAYLHELPDAALREGGDTAYKRAKLTFGQDVGDAPDDWYIVYRNPNNDRIDAMSYIVTYAKPQEKAEQSPSAIVYEGYQRVDGVMLSTQWRFYHWNAESGIHGQPKGKVTISNVEFVEPEAGTFTRPDGAARDPLPGE